MATLILRPNAAGDSTLWTPNTGANYAAVDEAVNDGDTTYVSNPSTSSKDDLYNIETSDTLIGVTITNVRVYVSAKYVLSGTSGTTPAIPNIYQLVKVGSVYASPASALTNAYADSYYDWALNPADSAAWEKADIDSLQVGIRGAMTAGSGNKLHTPRGTQVWVVVTYTEVTLSAVGNIASAFAAGAASIALALALTGIAGAEVIGSPVVAEGAATVELTAVGIASAEAHGTQAIGPGLAPGGIATNGSFGAGSISPGITAAGIATAGAMGTQAAALGVTPSGIATAEASGSPLTGLALSATGIATGEALGAQSAALTLAPNGIATVETFGTPGVEEGAVPTEITDAGNIASAEAVGTGSIAPSLGNTGIASGEIIGTSEAAPVLVPTGLVSAEAVGTPIVAVPPPPVDLINVGAIASAEGLGTPVVTEGPAPEPVDLINVGAIASAEGLGTPVVTEGPAEEEIAINLISPLVTSISIETNMIESIDVISAIITEINTTSEVF